ncbi:MAG TPA: HAD-IIIC family phosphatase [Geminicoccaceae bacterium]|nr:HAD-IIIC family phosphatase [Geminicoccaceae bacterium]
MLEVVKRAACVDDIVTALTDTDIRRLTGREVTVVSRQIEKVRRSADLRIAYLGSHTIEPLPQYVSVAATARGILVAGHVGDFNQYYQEILAEASELKAFDPQLIFLSISLRELAPQLCFQFSTLGAAEKRAAHESVVDHVMDWVEQALKATRASILVTNFVVPPARQAGIGDLHQADGETAFCMRLNLELLERLAGNPRTYLFDMEGVVGRFGKGRAFSPTMYHLAKMPWQELLLPHIADELLRYALAHLGRSKKCLVMDLDNTVWGGVLGEEGAEGIEVGPGSATGEAFQAFQRALVMLKDRGVMLAVNSKNNEDDVREAFRLRSEMPLKLEDFAALRINWESKHENLVAIAEDLNIGIDSLVFVDDNPVECALIEEMLPAVTVVPLPDDPADYADLLLDRMEFEKLSITAEDRVKAKQYQEQRQRAEHRAATGDLDAYLASLQTEIRIRPPSEGQRARVHQLFSKTNQFNVTTRRYSPADIDRFLSDERFVLRTIEAADRFGPLGIIGVYLVDLSNGTPHVDSFLMSCRAIGRGIETAVMNTIKQEFLLSRRHAALSAEFVPTKKNVPARNFYPAQGFTLVAEGESGQQSFELRADGAATIDCPHVAIV